MSKVTVRQGEAQVLPFRIRNKKTMRWLDLTGATFLLWVKRHVDDAAPVIQKADSLFNKAGMTSGYVSVYLEAVDTFIRPGVYKAELRVVEGGSPVLIAKLSFDFEVIEAVSPSDWALTQTGITSLETLGTPAVAIM